TPYINAPKLPEGERVDVRTLVKGEWLELEVGPGRGGFLFERARAVPTAGLVGLEVRRKWASIVDARLAKQGFGERVRVFAEDAKDALGRLSPDGSVRRIFLHFPDPWWKKKHQKRLVMGRTFLDEAARLLEPGGELFIQTDVSERGTQYETEVMDSALFEAAGDRTNESTLAENPYDARSPREHRAIEDGLPVYRFRFLKK
ncbi:MAG: tRNA (guanine-N7)-methyltransferase, partial [Polyangiaceae bacterium]